MRGPVNPSMKSDFGVLVDGQQYPPTIMMAHSPARYDQHLVSAGFDIAKTFYAFRLVFSQHADEYTPRWKELRTAQAKINARYPQLKFRAIESATYEKTLREINHLGNDVRSEGWGFVPLTEAELDFMIKNLRPVIRFDMIHAAYWDDQLVGYIVNIPDVFWALKRTWWRWYWLRMLQLPLLIRRTPKTRVIALGVDASFRNKGVAMMLIQRLIDRWNEYDEWEFSWVAEDNLKSIRAIERAVPVHQYKTYRLYEKVIG
jgi:GNAT superfamily N-acetyltransferase